MKKSFEDTLKGYQTFREKYVTGDHSLMADLASDGQNPEIMVVACSDSRVDPALLLQCEPGDLFVVRNVANIIPPYEKDTGHHGTSAALEFGLCYLNIKHLIILGHSQCGGIEALLNQANLEQNDFISRWVSLINDQPTTTHEKDHVAKQALLRSYEHCLTFPWIKKRIDEKQLLVHLWFFNIRGGEIMTYSFDNQHWDLGVKS